MKLLLVALLTVSFTSFAQTQIGSNINGEAEGDRSGNVSLSADGNIVAIGTPNNSGNGNYSGTVRIYKNESDTWTQVGTNIDGEAEGDFFGSSVSLSSDGNIVAIGSPFTNNYLSGTVRIYKNESDIWTQLGVDIDANEGDFFGSSVSLSSDGNIVAIAAPGNNNNGGINSGSVRVYDLSTVLNLEDNFIAKQFNLYPNPASDRIHLSLNSEIELQGVKLYNVLVQPVLESKVKVIDVSNLSKGVYYLEITTNEGKGVKKVIIE